MTYFLQVSTQTIKTKVFLAVFQCIQRGAFVSANEMAHEPPGWRNISLKNGDGTGSETRPSLMVADRFCKKCWEGENLSRKTKRSFVPILFTSQANHPINMASFQIVRSNSSNYLCKPWWVGISCIHGCTFVPGLVHCTGRACWGLRSRKNNDL